MNQEGKRLALATGEVWEAFRATLSDCLEPNGWGTRFPVLLERLATGRLSSTEVTAALAELEVAEKGLATLPAARIVWRRDNLSFRPRVPPIRPAATSAADALPSTDGQPLLVSLREWLNQAGPEGVTFSQPASLGSWQRHPLVYFLVGATWVIVGLWKYPDWLFVPFNTRDDQVPHGFLIWPFGLWILAAGAIRFGAERSPTLKGWLTRSASTAVWAFLLAAALFFVAIWR